MSLEVDSPEVNMEVDPPEVNMEVDPQEVNMEVDLPRSEHRSGPPEVNMEVDPPLDGPARVTHPPRQTTHQPYINWQVGSFPLKKGFLLVLPCAINCENQL